MRNKPILVSGATGKTGARIAARLSAAGYQVRAGSRSGAVPFDWDQPATWPAALDGVGAVYICFQPDFAFPGALETLSRFAYAVADAGVERVVMLTGRGEPAALKGETLLREICPQATILRSAWFAQNFSEGSLRDAVMSGVLPLPGGDVREPVIDLEDLADVGFAALTEERHAGQVYELTGPRLMSFNDIAADLSDAMERTVRHVPISFDEFHGELERSAGRTFADIVTDIARETFDGRNAHLTGGVERAIGRPPRDFSEFAAREARSGAWHARPQSQSLNIPTNEETTMTPTWYQKTVLGFAGLTALGIGVAITLTPGAFYASYGIVLGADPNLLSEVRAPGANLAALGLLMLAGVVRSSWFGAARALAVTLFFAFAAGRAISWGLDGAPDTSVQIALGLEVLIGALVLFAGRRRRGAGQQSQTTPQPA